MAKETKAKPAAKTAKKSAKVNYAELPEKDLYKKIDELKSEALDLKRGTKVGDVQNVRAYKYKRRELARALTARNTAKEVK